MIHLTTHQLSSYLDRELPESSTELVRRHLDACKECTLWFAAFREQEAVLDRVLTHDPGEEFFTGFADKVLGAPKTGPVSAPASARAAPEAPARAEVPGRRDALPAPTPTPRRSARAPAIPWFAAAVLCLIVGAIGYTLPRPGPTTPPANTPAAPPTPDARGPAPTRAAMTAPPSAVPPPAASVDRGRAGVEPGAARELPVPESTARELPVPESIAPVRRIITTTEVVPAPVAWSRTETLPKPRAPEAPDEFAAAPLTAAPLIGAARKASNAAALDSSAANLDAAGSAWEKVIPTLSGAEQMIARQKLAEARYRAWMAAPDPYRAAAATAALRSFLVLSPPGPRHDLARAWLKRINGG